MKQTKKTRWSFGFHRETETFTEKEQKSLLWRLFAMPKKQKSHSSTPDLKSKDSVIKWLLE